MEIKLGKHLWITTFNYKKEGGLQYNLGILFSYIPDKRAYISVSLGYIDLDITYDF